MNAFTRFLDNAFGFKRIDSAAGHVGASLELQAQRETRAKESAERLHKSGQNAPETADEKRKRQAHEKEAKEKAAFAVAHKKEIAAAEAANKAQTDALSSTASKGVVAGANAIIPGVGSLVAPIAGVVGGAIGGFVSDLLGPASPIPTYAPNIALFYEMGGSEAVKNYKLSTREPVVNFARPQNFALGDA